MHANVHAMAPTTTRLTHVRTAIAIAARAPAGQGGARRRGVNLRVSLPEADLGESCRSGTKSGAMRHVVQEALRRNCRFPAPARLHGL